MKIKHLLTHSFLGLALVSGLTATAQETQKIQPCNTFAAMEEHFAQDPSAKVRYDNIQSKMQKDYLQYEANRNANKGAAAPAYTIPVVFHILHQGGAENIPDIDCINALAFVNKDYARTNSDANQTDPPFDVSYINSDIVFMLAHKDPNGNCTNGIVHHVSTLTDWQQANNATNYIFTWDPTKYLNIYVVKNIVPTTTVSGGGIIVGYTFLPGTWPQGAGQDAIVYRYNYLQSGTDPRSLGHEMGHWLNLQHTWGSTNNPGVSCGDDGVSDTPETKGDLFSCPSTSVNTCAQTVSPALAGLSNVQNIMNYANCPINFTTGQTNRMRTTLASGPVGRTNLTTAGNLTATDVNGVTSCAPVADWMSTAAGDYTVCALQSINLMKDFSFNAPVTSWLWTATNGATITAPTSSNTIIYFPTAGLSLVTLSVSNAQGGSSLTRTITVVNSAVTATNGIMESFEGSGTPAGWSVINPSGIGWTQTSNAALHGQFSFLLDGSISGGNQEDILMMPTMDFLSNPGAMLRFSYAYRRKTTTQNDVFKVQLSSDCGGSWKDVFAPSASNLALNSGGVSTANFVPIVTEWKTQDVSNHPNYNSFSTSPSVMGRFYFMEGSGGFGKQLYIDSVNLVAAPVGINELSRHLLLTLSPNPTNGSANLNFVLSNDASVKVTIMDIAGKLVSPEKAYNFGAGDHKIVLNENATLSKGIYIVSLEYNGTKLARKLVIE